MITLGSLNALLGVIGFVSAIVLALGRTVWMVAELKTDLAQLKADLNKHLADSSLHRNPDSEARWLRLESTLDQLQKNIADIRGTIGAVIGGGSNAKHS